jgi:hypothetical protein
MSSTYRLICMAHDPAIVIDRDHPTLTDALAALLSDEITEAHPHCLLLIGRWSGGLIEVTCADLRHADHRGHRTVDAAFLRVVLAAYQAVESVADPDGLLGALNRLPTCWGAERIRPLRYELGVSGG